MKIFNLCLLLAVLIVAGCFPAVQSGSETIDNHECDDYRPFYSSNTTATYLNVECDCQDSIIDIAGRLAPYNVVEEFLFSCNAATFDAIPAMPSVLKLRTPLITGNLTAFSNVKHLDLAYLESTIPDVFDNLNSLEELEILLKETTLSATEQQYIFKSPSLKELKIWQSLDAIDASIDQLTTLERLEIREGNFTFPSTFSNLSNLKHLSIRSNSIQVIPTEILGLSNTLENLFLSECDLSAIPVDIGNFQNLKNLSFSDNENLNSCPAEIENLKDNLENLFLSNTGFDERAKEQIRAWLPNTIIYFE